MNRVFVVLATLVAAALCAAPAQAQDEDQVVAPPGNSGVEEYLEVVPGAGGDHPAGGGGQAADTPSAVDNDTTSRQVLGARTAEELRSLGADGRAAAAAAVAGAPRAAEGGSAAKEKQRGSGARDSNPSGSITPDSDGGRAEAVVGALAGNGGGLGLAFPLLLLGALAAAVGLLAVRRIARDE